MKRFISLFIAVIMTALLSVTVFGSAPVDKESVNTDWASFSNYYDIEGYTSNIGIFEAEMSIRSDYKRALYSAEIKWDNNLGFGNLRSAYRLEFDATYQRKTHYTEGHETSVDTEFFTFPEYEKAPGSYASKLYGMGLTTTPNDPYGFSSWIKFSTKTYFYTNLPTSSSIPDVDDWHDYTYVSAWSTDVQDALK